jgi:hypothetical protein
MRVKIALWTGAILGFVFLTYRYELYIKDVDFSENDYVLTLYLLLQVGLFVVYGWCLKKIINRVKR